MTTEFYPVGTQVVLTGLQAAPEHNGKYGVVESTAGERQRVRLIISDNDEKVLAIKPKNLQIAPRSSETLSVKELKTILQVCEYSGTTTGMDKRDLQAAVVDLSTPQRNAEILMQQARKQQQKQTAPSSSSSSSSSATTTATPAFSKEQMQSAADRMSSMDPASLRQQAAMMRAMPPDQLRRSNPMFANMSDAQIQQMISQFEMMASNPAMMAQAAQQMKNMSPEDLEHQRQAVLGNTSTSSASAAPVNTSATTAASARQTLTQPAVNNSADMMSQMKPEQIKQQAEMLKSMPPQQVRSMHPQFANMSDGQIQQMAAQMELMAENPAMMKMAAETMKNMTPEQMAEIQQGRIPNASVANGDGSAQPPITSMDQAANLLSSMSGKQVKEMLKMAKDNPDLFKNAAPTGTDSKQMESVLERLDSMDEATLDRILSFLQGLQKVASPFVKAYQTANQAVRGQLFKIIVASVVGLIAYRWFFAGTTSMASPVAPIVEERQPPVETVADEFEF